jgi:hypothetical protein
MGLKSSNPGDLLFIDNVCQIRVMKKKSLPICVQVQLHFQPVETNIISLWTITKAFLIVVSRYC